jgi:hypothetical protein
VGGAGFNCFYSIKDPTAVGDDSYGFGIDIVMWNVLYNLGYMYNDVIKSINIYEDSDDPEDWENLGYYIGDFIMRFFWSRYIPKTYSK